MLGGGVVLCGRVVDGVVEASRLVALHCLTHNQVAHIYYIAQLANLSTHLARLEELLGLLIENVESVPGAVQTQIAADYSHVCAHDFAHFLGTLRDEHHLLGVLRALVVPLGDILAEGVLVDVLHAVLCSCIGIYNSLNERV